MHVTRSEQKAAMCYSDRPGNDGVVIKLKVALGTYAEIYEQGHPLQKTWMEHGYGSAFAPAGAIGVREENCIAGPSRIEIIGLARGYKAPCRYGLDCTRKMRCKFDHGHGDDKRYLWKGAGDSKYSSGNGKHRKRKSPSTKRQATKRQRLWQKNSWKTGE